MRPDQLVVWLVERNPFWGSLTFGFGIAFEIALAVAVIVRAVHP